MSGKPAARITDMHTCPGMTGTVPHVGGPIITGEPTVLIGSLPAARISDKAVCVGPLDVIVQGSPTVIIGNMPASRIGDMSAHGGVIVTGMPTVLIGESGGGGGGGGGGLGAALGAAAAAAVAAATSQLQDFAAAEIESLGFDEAAPAVPSPIDGLSTADAHKALEKNLTDAVAVLEKRKKDIAAWNDETAKSFETYFGTTDEAARETVSKRIDRSIDKLKALKPENFEPAEQKVLDKFPEANRKRLNGYVRPNDDSKVFLGPNYANLPDTGKNSKVGTLVHEVSHFKSVSGTVDHGPGGPRSPSVYGEEGVKAMAKKHPEHALNHANAYRYFIEDGF